MAEYVMNICHLGKGDNEELNKTKEELRKDGKRGGQANDERLYLERTGGG